MAREMKDSGIAWIGEIPREWDTIKIKYTSWLKGRIGWQGLTTAEYVDEGPYLVTGTDFSAGVVDWNKCVHISKERYLMDSDIQIREGDLLITKDGTVGKVAIARNCPPEVSLNSGVMLIRNTGDYKYFDKYLFYVLTSDEFWRWYILSQTGQSTIKHLYQEQFYNFEFTFPKYNEQRRIADFLDAECARIDAVIEQTRASIEEYKKLKQSVITQAVTKGIRPNRKMKDSGIEWIGEIPEEWKTTKIKYISSGVGDGLHAAPEFIENGLYYFINGNNLGDKEIRIKENTNSVSEEEYSKYNQPVLCTNAILIALNGTYGLVSFYNGEKIMLGKSAGYINLFPTIERNYVRYALLSDYSKRQMDDSLAGTTIANVSLRTIRNISIAWPSEIEQEEISRYLDAKCFELDRLLTGKTQLINELESYKKSLIYEYVTGKKEVV